MPGGFAKCLPVLYSIAAINYTNIYRLPTLCSQAFAYFIGNFKVPFLIREKRKPDSTTHGHFNEDYGSLDVPITISGLFVYPIQNYGHGCRGFQQVKTQN